MNENITLIRLNAYTTGVKYLPYGLLYIANSLEQEGYKPTIRMNHDAKKIKEDEKEILKHIQETQPLFIGFSVNTGRTTELSAKLSKIIKKKFPTIPIVWGGVHPTIMPNQCISEKYIDYLILGEGEESIKRLTNAIKNKVKPLGDGIAYKTKTENVIRPQQNKIQDLDKYEPAFHLINVKEYLKPYKYKNKRLSRVFTYLTSRGCPFQCGFCANQSMKNNQMRYRSITHVTNMINKMKKDYDIDGVWFNDDNFFVNKERAFRIGKEIKMAWWAESRIPMLANNKWMKKVRNANIMRIMCGAESGCNKTLLDINKGITKEQIRLATQNMAKNNIECGYTFILGFPNETENEMLETIKFTRELDKIYKGKERMFDSRIGKFIPYPGSPLYHEALKKGFISPNKTEDWDFEGRENTSKTCWCDNKMIKNIINYNMILTEARKKNKLLYGLFGLVFDHKIRKGIHTFKNTPIIDLIIKMKEIVRG